MASRCSFGAAIGASYEGTLNAEGAAINGVWSQGGQQLPLTLERQKQAFALNRPQLPKAPFPYESREVSFESEAGKIRLAGTLLVARVRVLEYLDAQETA